MDQQIPVTSFSAPDANERVASSWGAEGTSPQVNGAIATQSLSLKVRWKVAEQLP
jgi:hypothetical protein